MTDTTNSTRPAWVDDSLFPFESRFIEIDGHTVHYVDEGSGPILLLLHGNPTWSFLWREVISALRDDFRCIALDYPGFGLSTPRPGYRYLPEEHAEVVGKFVDVLGISGATLVGQDWGGMIGLAVAQRRPGTFDRLCSDVLSADFRCASWSVGSIFSSKRSSPPVTVGASPPQPR